MFFGKPPEGNYTKRICPGCDPDARAPYFVSHCYPHATRRPISVHEGATSDVMPSRDVLRDNTA